MIKPVSEWKEIFSTNEKVRYINDHTIFQDADGEYHLLGTTSGDKKYNVLRERKFIEAISNRFDGRYQKHKFVFDKSPHRTLKISPYVFYDEAGRTYHLFFGPGKIYHYTSLDGKDWSYRHVAINSVWPFLRDPSIFEHNGKYLMYLTGSNNRIVVYESQNLDDWKFASTALKLKFGSPRSPNSACESPTVIQIHTKYYLFTTIVPSLIGTKKNYNSTYIFESDDPTKFGTFSGHKSAKSNLVGKIEAHAPEVFLKDDKVFYTSCGWSGMPKPDGISCDGVCMRELQID